MENSPQEILDIAIEMRTRIVGNWSDTQEDEEMQQEFWKIMKPVRLHYGGPIKSRIATTFLRKNSEYLS